MAVLMASAAWPSATSGGRWEEMERRMLYLRGGHDVDDRFWSFPTIERSKVSEPEKKSTRCHVKKAQREPKMNTPNLRLARLLWWRQEYEKAEENYLKTLSWSRNESDSHSIKFCDGSFWSAVRPLSVSSHFNDEAAIISEFSMFLYEKQRMVLEADPMFTIAIEFLGDILETEGRWDEAEAFYMRAPGHTVSKERDESNSKFVIVDPCPAHATYLTRLARVFRRSNYVDLAMEYLRAALTFKPDHSPALQLQKSKGVCHLDVDEHMLAIKCFEEALSLSPSSLDGKLAMAEAKKGETLESYHWKPLYKYAVRMKQRRIMPKLISKAEKLAYKAYQLHPKDQNVHKILANLHHNLNDDRSAMKSLLKALWLEPNDPIALNDVGHLLATQHNYDEARKRFEQARRANPLYVQADISLAALYLAVGQYEDAMKFRARAEKTAPDCAPMEFVAGLAEQYGAKFGAREGGGGVEVGLGEEKASKKPCAEEGKMVNSALGAVSMGDSSE
ncbi:hypothetical protein GUITHDRAFT_106891 [Guillardia theta CCMP2712]|uniref:Uncharacterized protein n=1 Tax=Guillardia theta (strain CCMP2712) TaxID=905079 RepID=L1JH77_GUITC|nr:hypothetical protein GUITHDRAFT_106891 [Guillardia theta CCMP2712]EKX47450.1 hypothetical protein GUITHDRAFT_106891 [Guillardia theta CCMP2712]|eukprot:XP_005834430.1 hypothetical protein GUITHDRAFT_106891 [Guillardia theta CCMP2712]